MIMKIVLNKPYQQINKSTNQQYLTILLAFLFISCVQNEDAPYITFKNAAGDIITSNAWKAKLDTTELLYIECGFVEGGYILYERQVDDGPNFDLVFGQSNDIKILSSEVKNNLHIEKAVISTTFDSDFMKQGSEVKITIRDRSEMAKNFTYIVQ